MTMITLNRLKPEGARVRARGASPAIGGGSGRGGAPEAQPGSAAVASSQAAT